MAGSLLGERLGHRAGGAVLPGKEPGKLGGMGVYQFHGIGGQIFEISSETHRAFLAYLKAHESEYEIMRFWDAMERVKGSYRRFIK